jgi:hypothetical protein
MFSSLYLNYFGLKASKAALSSVYIFSLFLDACPFLFEDSLSVPQSLLPNIQVL